MQFPSKIFSLEDLGYNAGEIEDMATTFGISEPFRILSAEGSEILLETARRLKPFSRRAGNRMKMRSEVAVIAHAG